MLEASDPALAAHPFIAPLAARRIRSLAAFKASAPGLIAAFGGALPVTPRRVAYQGAQILWNGPGQWLVLGELDIPAGLGAVTEQSDGLFLLGISGPHAVGLLKKLLAIDIERFGADDVAITLAAHIGVRVWREDEMFVLACFRSFARALHHALVEAGPACSPERG